MNTLDELRKAWEDARDATRKAREVEKERLNALVQAELEASGLDGHLVEYDVHYGYRPVKTRTHRMRVDGIRGDYFIGELVRKDGSIGRRVSVERHMVRDLGLYNDIIKS